MHKCPYWCKLTSANNLTYPPEGTICYIYIIFLTGIHVLSMNNCKGQRDIKH